MIYIYIYIYIYGEKFNKKVIRSDKFIGKESRHFNMSALKHHDF